VVANGSKIMFLTNKRLLIRKLSVLKRETIQDVPYDKISSIQLRKGFRSSKILISTSGYDIEIDSLKKEVAERALDYLKQVTHKSEIKNIIDLDDYDVSTRPDTSVTEDSKRVSFSIADELEKLSKLKNENVISEEEFQMMKTDLFKRMSKQ
ncbi:MAG: PH domain-containing protein, partial [Nitrososphaeraceae archaeon]